MRSSQRITLLLIIAVCFACHDGSFDCRRRSNGELSHRKGSDAAHEENESSQLLASSESFLWLRRVRADGKPNTSIDRPPTRASLRPAACRPDSHGISFWTRCESFEPQALGTSLRLIWTCRSSLDKVGKSDRIKNLCLRIVARQRTKPLFLAAALNSASAPGTGYTLVEAEPSESRGNLARNRLSAVPSERQKELIFKNLSLGREFAREQGEKAKALMEMKLACKMNWRFVHFSPSTGSYWTIVVTMLVLVAIPILGWYALGETE